MKRNPWAHAVWTANLLNDLNAHLDQVHTSHHSASGVRLNKAAAEFVRAVARTITLLDTPEVWT